MIHSFFDLKTLQHNNYKKGEFVDVMTIVMVLFLQYELREKIVRTGFGLLSDHCMSVLCKDNLGKTRQVSLKYHIT